MPAVRTATTASLALIALLAAACYQPASGDQPAEVSAASGGAGIPTATPILQLPDPVILSVDTPTPGPVRRNIDATPVATVPAAPESTPTSPQTASTPNPATPTPAAEPTAIPTTTPPIEESPSPVAAVPFTDVDLVAAIVDRDLAYSPQQQRTGCTGRAADVRHLDAANSPPFTLWTYPTSDDLKADWILPSSGAPRPTIADCTIDGGWIYWYENLVIAFEPQAEWIPEPSVRELIVQAFFSLTR